MAKPVSPIRGAILGLLADRPTYTYDVGARLGGRLGLAWDLKAPNVYGIMDALEDAGLVVGERADEAADDAGPERQLPPVRYSITEPGQEWLADWMRTPLEPEPARTHLLAKLAVARPQHLADLLNALDGYEQKCLRLIRELNDEQARAFDGPATPVLPKLMQDVVRSNAEGHLKAELEWIVSVRCLLASYLDNLTEIEGDAA